MSVGFYQTTWSHILEDSSHICETSDFMKLFYYRGVLMVYYMKDCLVLGSHIALETGYIFVFRWNGGDTPMDLGLIEEP